MSFAPYLSFNGTCAQAMTFYAGVFAAKDLQIMTVSQAPAGSYPAVADQGFVMHSQLTVGGATLMASDNPEGKPVPQTGFSIHFTARVLASAESIFTELGDGGTIQMPFAKTFWSPGFGALRDRFGTNWMVSAPAD